jgi:hypothetical protein
VWRHIATVQDSELVVIEIKDIGPIAEAYPALHERLASLHSKRHAKEQRRLVKMLEEKAHELGVSPDSTIITKIKEKAEALMEENSKRLEATQVKAALRIQRMFRGSRFRRALSLQQQCERTEELVDPDREAVKLLRSFSLTRLQLNDWLESSDTKAAPEVPSDTAGAEQMERSKVEEVAHKSWKKLQRSRAEFQEEYREKAKTSQALARPDQLAAKIESLEASLRALQSKDMLHGLDDRVMHVMQVSLEQFFSGRQTTGNGAAALHTGSLSSPDPPPGIPGSTARNSKGVVGQDVIDWLHSRGLDDMEDVLGTLGSTLSDFALLTEQDIDALKLKPLTRRRLARELSQLDGSLLSSTAADG